MRFKIYIDYDEDPAIGGQQGIFPLDGTGHGHDYGNLIGCRIVDACYNEKELPQSLGYEGRVLILTLEKDTDEVANRLL